MKGVRHAFSLDDLGAAEPDEALRSTIDRVCRAVVRRRLTMPVQMALEMSRPLNYVGAQALHVLQPIIAVVLDTGEMERFARFLEHRGSVDWLRDRIEHFDAESRTTQASPEREHDGEDH